MVSLRGTLANPGLRYEIGSVKQQGGPMPELSTSGRRLDKKEVKTCLRAWITASLPAGVLHKVGTPQQR